MVRSRRKPVAKIALARWCLTTLHGNGGVGGPISASRPWCAKPNVWTSTLTSLSSPAVNTGPPNDFCCSRRVANRGSPQLKPMESIRFQSPSVLTQSNPPLPPHAVVLQVSPSNHLNSFRKYRFDFHQFNRFGWQLGLDHSADQTVLLLGHGLVRCPFGQQKIFWG